MSTGGIFSLMEKKGVFQLAYEQALLFGLGSEVSLARPPAPRGFAARSRVLARLASLAQIGELARRLYFSTP